MPERTEYSHGTFSWLDLATTDTEAAKQFYLELFGWELHDTPAGPDMVYTMARRGGKDVAAIFGMRKEMADAGVPAHWANYVTVDDVDAMAAAAESLGAQVVAAPFDVMDAGRMTTIKDPAGATLNLWTANKNIGAHVVNEPGALVWNELFTTDLEKSREFYTKLFGWGAETQDMGFPYVVFQNDGEPAAGMMEINKEWGPVPPHWVPYLGVENADATVAKAEAGGATVYVAPTDVPNVGRFAMFRDPQGAPLAIMQLE